MNLRPSSYEPNIFGGFLPNIRAVDKWWTVLMNLILGGQLVDRPRDWNSHTKRKQQVLVIKSIQKCKAARLIPNRFDKD